MSVLVRELDNLFRDLNFASENQFTTYHQYSTADEYVLEVALVGVKKEDVIVDVQEGILNVTAKTEVKSRLSKNFRNSWILAKDSDSENVSAVLENGLLQVKVPKVKPLKKVVNVTVV